MTTKTTERKQRTITLTGRRPVKIHEDEWPVIATAGGDSYSGNDYGGYQQAKARGEVDTYLLRVRQHADGRAIVYAVFDAASAWTHNEDQKGGELLDEGSDIPAAIRRVGEDCDIPDSVIRECVSALPAEEI